MNLLPIAIVSLLLSAGAFAQTPVTEKMTIAPAKIPKPLAKPQPVATPASPGKISDRSRAGSGAALPAVQRPAKIPKTETVRLTPLDDARTPKSGGSASDDAEMNQLKLQKKTQNTTQSTQTISNVQKKKKESEQSTIRNIK